MIVEGLLTTKDAAGSINIAPMGPIVHGDFEALTFRPWAGSTSYQNLLHSRCGVFHLVDSVNLIARTAIGKMPHLPRLFPAKAIDGMILEDCCRWFEFRVIACDTSEQRAELQAEIVHTECRHPFRGFNRARHAVIEAAILATRIQLLHPEEIQGILPFLISAVRKTGGPDEMAAMDLLLQHFQNAGICVE